jgi:parallel beta-helix repeat protein
MAVIREENFLGQQRVDVPHLRSLDAGVDGDIDVLAGSILSGKAPTIVSGFVVLTSNMTGAAVTNLQIATANSVVMHYLASENGTILNVPADRPIETLNASNSRLQGAFTASATNYVGLDYLRQADPATADLVQFLDADTLQETPKRVPLARTLDYVLSVSVQDFSITPGICPLCIVVTDSENHIVSITDARNMFAGLGTGGSVPNALGSYAWPGGRTSSSDNSVFTDGDKAIPSLQDWMKAVLSRVWELGGGERWFSPTADRNVIMTRTGSPLSNGEYFSWDGSNLSWSGISFLFDNSTGFRNDVTSSSLALPDGYCLYVDLDRTQNRISGTNALTAQIAPLATLGTPAVPGSRWIMAWRLGSGNFCVYTRDTSFPVNSSYQPATQSALGIVKLNYGSAVAPAPVVPVTNSAGNVVGLGLSRANAGGATAPGVGTLAIGPDSTDDLTITIGNTASKTFALGLQTLSAYDFTIGDGVNSIGDFNASDFGNDVALAINAAIAAVPTIGGIKSCNLLLKTGSYTVVNNSVTVDNSITSFSITGESEHTTILFSVGNTVPVFNIAQSTLGNSTRVIRSIRLKLVSITAAGVIIPQVQLAGANNLFIYDSSVFGISSPTSGGPTTGMFVNSSTGPVIGAFSSTSFIKCSTGSYGTTIATNGQTAGINLTGSSQVVFDNCLMDHPSSGPLMKIDNSTYIHVTNCQMFLPAVDAVQIGGTTACSNVFFQENRFIQNFTTTGTTLASCVAGIRCVTGGCAQLNVSNNTFENCDIGVYLDNSNGIISHNIFNAAVSGASARGVYGIVIAGTAASNDVLVDSNYIVNLADVRIASSGSPAKPNVAGVLIGTSGAGNVRITNNTIETLSGIGAGVALQGNTNDCIIANNRISTCTYGHFSLSSTSHVNMSVQSNIVSNFTGSGITVSTISNSTIANNTIQVNYNPGSAATTNGISISGNCTSLGIIGNTINIKETTFLNSRLTAIGVNFLAGATAVNVNDNFINLDGGNTNRGIWTSSSPSSNLLFEGNSIYFTNSGGVANGATNTGIVLATSTSSAVNNNEISMNASQTIASDGFAISFGGSSFSSINGNNISSSIGGGNLSLLIYVNLFGCTNISMTSNTITTAQDLTNTPVIFNFSSTTASTCYALGNTAFVGGGGATMFSSAPNSSANPTLS